MVGVHAYVVCDHLDKGAAPGQRLCHERFEYGSTVAAARRAAKQSGWTVKVHSSGEPYRLKSIPAGGYDYCPQHKPRREG